VLLHAFRKNTRAVPAADIRIALELWADFRERMNAPTRTPRRAVGGDAPMNPRLSILINWEVR
jgi:hypothetical protein